ncbi:MAG: DEAD/DEAH box helicase [Candidatus Methanospirareceae archaeon]
MRIEELIDWGEAKRVNTKKGPRNLRKAEPNQNFWSAWKQSKAELKAAGVSVGKHYKTGKWEVCWWMPISSEEQQQTQESIAASKATDADIAIPSPEGLEYLPYQKAGIAYAMARQNVLIGDEMGLGKTIQAIGIFNADPTIRRMLVICPASLRLNWAREIKKWATRQTEIAVINGGKPSDWPENDPDVVIVNYDVVRKHRGAIDTAEWDLLVVDEAHYLKNPKAQRTRSILGWKTQSGAIKLHPIQATKRVFLTGTPIVNRPIDLWPLVHALDPQGMGRNFFRFAKRYADAYHGTYGWDFSGASHLDELQENLRRTIMVRRLKKDVLVELPAKRRQVMVIPANGASAAVQQEMSIWNRFQSEIERLEAELEADPESESTRSELAKAKRIAFTEMAQARHEVALAKVPVVCDRLATALEEGPVVCFAHHKDVIAKIAEEFSDRVAVITGDTSLADRQQAVDDFQHGKVDLLIGNIQAAGVGITLTRSSRVVFAELDWVPGNLTQAEDRCHRIGQQESVLIQHIVLEGSLDEIMAASLIRKQEVIEQAMDNPTQQRYDSSAVDVSKAEISFEKTEVKAIDSDLVDATREAIGILAGQCDGALRQDGEGFNRIDSNWGKFLAHKAEWSPREAEGAIRMVKKYHRQLPDRINNILQGENKQ